MSQDKSTKNTDLFVLVASLIIVVLSVGWMLSNDVFQVSLLEDEKLSWHLVRSSGIIAFVLLLASTVWGLLLSSQLVKDWSPGPVAMTIHSTISWLAVLLGLAHGLLLLLDKYFTYTLADILIPLIGPYRPEAVGLGTLAFWLLLAISVSFPLKKWLSHERWKKLHYVSYIAFALAALHGLLAGTDSAHAGFRVLLGGGLLLVVLLLGIRLGRSQLKASPAPARRGSR